MDPREARKKASEAGAQGEAPEGGDAGARPPEASPAPPPAAEGVLTDADVIEGELAARLQGLTPAEDGRFATWRPGSGAPPPAPVLPLPPPRESREDDFVLVSALGEGMPALALPEPPGPARPGAPADPLDEFFYREDEAGPELPVVGGQAEPAPPEDRESGAREEYLTFALGDEQYGIAIARVREVMRSPPITEVPHAPPHVLGVVTVRGEVVAVFDPRRRLALPGPAPAAGVGRLVIVDVGEGPCGLLVDAVSSVVRVRAGSIEARPQGIGGAGAECLAGIGRHGERLFTVLDLGAFLRRSPGAPRRAGEGKPHAGA